MNPKHLIFLLLTIGIYENTYCQKEGMQEADFLVNSSYEEIYGLLGEVYDDTLVAKSYIKFYENKAIKEKDTLQIITALTLSSYYETEEEDIMILLDNAINLANQIESGKIPIMPFSFKAGYFLDKGDYQKALDNYLIALNLSKDQNNIEYEFITKHNIAVIKGEIGRNKEALETFKECMEYEHSKKGYNSHEYITSLLYLGEYYIKNEQLDSAITYIDKGVFLSKQRYGDLYGQLLIQRGIYHFTKGQNDIAKNDIIEGLSLKGEDEKVYRRIKILSNFYLGEIEREKGQIEEAKRFFIKMDSLTIAENYSSYEIRPGYLFLINYFKKSNQQDQQLKYVDRLIGFDSVNNVKGYNISNRLNREYDTPELIGERDLLIKNLENQKAKTTNYVFSLGFLTFLLLIALVVQHKRRKILLNRFDSLIDGIEVSSNDIIDKSKTLNTEPNFEISSEVKNRILAGLESFELNKGFLKNGISSSSLANFLNTNTKYLSYVINHYKEKSFSNYVKDLRIGYAISEIKKNKRLRQYTIEGIAEEVGFSNSQSFSVAFQNKTGIKPSYFIKRLNKLEKKMV